MSSGWSADLDWMEQRLKEKYDIKTQRIRDIEGEREVNILNRIVRLTSHGYEMEADPHHAELIVEQMMGKDFDPNRTVTSPGTDVEDKRTDCDNEQLGQQEAKAFRSSAAR